MAGPRKIELIPVGDIEIGNNRLRPLDRAVVDGLKVNLDDPNCPPLLPIEVCRKPGQTGWTLIDGLHRLTAWRELERPVIEALAHDNSTLTARMVELQRNLFTADLAPYSRAKHIAELYYLERAKRGLAPGDDPRRLGGRPLKALMEAEKETLAMIADVSLSDAVGNVLGLKGRRIRDYLTLFRTLSPQVAERIERMRLDLPAAQLMLLGRQVPDKQAEIVDRLLIPKDHPAAAVLARRVTTVSAALVREGQKSAGMKHLSAFKGAFARMSLAEKKGALINFRDQLPAGFALTTPDDEAGLGEVRDALNFTFEVLLDLLGGGDEVSDDRLKEAANQVQCAQIIMMGALTGRRKPGGNDE